MSHIHDWKPDVAPEYVCECGAKGLRSRKTGQVQLTVSGNLSYPQNGVFDQNRMSNFDPEIQKSRLLDSNRHVSRQEETEE